MGKFKVGKFDYQIKLSIEKDCWLDDESELYNKEKTQEEIKKMHFKNNTEWNSDYKTLKEHLSILNGEDENIVFFSTKTSGGNEIYSIYVFNALKLAKELRIYGIIPNLQEIMETQEFQKHWLSGYKKFNPQEIADYKNGIQKNLNSFEKRLNNALNKSPEKFWIRGYWANR